MPQSEAQKRAKAKYNAKAYEEIKIRVKKNQKEIIQNYAESKGLSLNGYIISLIEGDMSKDD